MNKFFELARIGKFKDRFGKTVELTKDNLQSIVDNYKPGEFQAPITVGHPENQKAPAWGWVDALKLAGEKLLFKPGRLVSEFAEAVNRGNYSNVSMGIDTDNWTLKHVAFLGGVAPAIKGLERITSVEFSESTAKVFNIECDESVKDWIHSAEFSDTTESWLAWQVKTIGRILRRLRDQTIEKDGTDKANALIPEYEIEDLTKEPPVDQTGSASEFSSDKGADVNIEMQLTDLQTKVVELGNQIAEFSTKLKAVEAENVTLKTKVSTLEDEKKALQTAARQNEFSEFCDSLILKGQLEADQKENTIKVMQSLDNGGTAEFSDGTKVASLEVYKKQLQSRPKVVEFSELMTHNRLGDIDSTGNAKYSELGKSIAATVNPKK
jgi:tRNA isopentenyl-2-thiomethyl-A-37 hydroxylase MiaE